MALTSSVEQDLIQRGLWLLAALGIQGRLLANLLDGMVAVEGGKASPVGELYNEVPDRISDVVIFIGAGLAMGGTLNLGLSAALVACFVAYIRAIGASVGAGQIFVGPMAKQHRMALITGMCLLNMMLPASWQPVNAESSIGIASGALILVIIGGVVTSIWRLGLISQHLRQENAAGADSNA